MTSAMTSLPLNTVQYPGTPELGGGGARGEEVPFEL
jgi:hypothetical protein